MPHGLAKVIAMPKTSSKKPSDFIVPLNMNGMDGRMLRMPAPKNKSREILFVYGHHSSLERWWGVIQVLNQYGAVTMPDLPGFGGMDSFYKIGKKPTIDNLADYLASFIKLRYKNRRISIAGLSFGFVVATRMLQRYPELAKKVDIFISVVGFSRYDDFAFSKTRHFIYRWAAKLFGLRLPAVFFKLVCLNPLVIRLAYARTHNAQVKFKGLTPENRRAMMDFEIHLWHSNEIRTYMYTTQAFLTLDNCNRRVDLPLYHVSVDADQYFDNQVVEQHLKIIFSDVNIIKSKMDAHAPSIIADKKTAAPLFPSVIRRLLAKQ